MKYNVKYTMFPFRNLVVQFLVSSVLGSIFVFVRVRALASANGTGGRRGQVAATQILMMNL